MGLQGAGVPIDEYTLSVSAQWFLVMSWWLLWWSLWEGLYMAWIQVRVIRLRSLSCQADLPQESLQPL